MLTALGGAVGLGSLGSTEALARDDDGDGSDERSVALDYLANDDLLDNDELEEILHSFAETYPEYVHLDCIGRTNQDRPIWAVRVASPDAEDPTEVAAVGQQHGDELLMAEGLLSALRYLVDDERGREWLEQVAVNLVPRVNPDGFVARQRYNVDTDAPARGDGDDVFGGDAGFFTASEPGVGWDVNRYHWPDWEESPTYENAPEEYPENPVPESRALLRMVDERDPQWIVDFHRQGEYVVDYDSTFDPDNPGASDDPEYPPDPDDSGGGDLVTASVFWPINEGVDEDVQALSKQVAYRIYDELVEYDEATVTRYPGGTYGGIARNGYGLQGLGSVLFELSAGTLGDREFRVQQAMKGVLSVVEATADGSLYDIDPEKVTELPERGQYFPVE
jgi:hypothetical protein